MIKWLMLSVSVLGSTSFIFGLNDGIDSGMKLIIMITGLGFFEVLCILERMENKQ